MAKSTSLPRTCVAPPDTGAATAVVDRPADPPAAKATPAIPPATTAIDLDGVTRLIQDAEHAWSSKPLSSNAAAVAHAQWDKDIPVLERHAADTRALLGATRNNPADLQRQLAGFEKRLADLRANPPAAFDPAARRDHIVGTLVPLRVRLQQTRDAIKPRLGELRAIDYKNRLGAVDGAEFDRLRSDEDSIDALLQIDRFGTLDKELQQALPSPAQERREALRAIVGNVAPVVNSAAPETLLTRLRECLDDARRELDILDRLISQSTWQELEAHTKKWA